MPTDETKALSRIAGQMTARILTSLGGAETNILWFFPARMMAIETLTERLLSKKQDDLFILDLAAGFSPRALHIANKYPQAKVIEVDLPDVVAEKKRRFKQGRIALPPNLSWIEADLGSTNLEDVLDGRKADLITSEGLTLYLVEEEQNRFFKQVEANLKPDGVFMCEVYFQDKFQKIRTSQKVNAVASFVLRMVGNVPGIIPDQETCRQRLAASGFTRVEEYLVTDMMDEIGQPKPVDIISIIVAHKASVEPDVGVVTEAVVENVEAPTPQSTLPEQAITDDDDISSSATEVET
jgi:O-methyltransferase involved in polyketide biosynthesis